MGMPKDFRFYDLRHTGNTLAADTGAKLKDLMVRAGQSSERAQLIYQHSTKEHRRRLADDIDATARLHRVPTNHRQSGHIAAGEVRALVPAPPAPPSGRAARVR
ncbi:hypothetical protein ACGFSI_01225 [Streptomyces virginiae]|uniref:hypothetical protein n=1 Tax=Streptomyces virginiae TaxID=1961 RepID=UPI00372427E0